MGSVAIDLTTAPYGLAVLRSASDSFAIPAGAVLLAVPIARQPGSTPVREKAGEGGRSC